MKLTAPWPHRGACPECETAKCCNYCGLLYADRCTNGRCQRCHSAHCTPGGATYPGHAFGDQGTTDHYVEEDV